jgi:hypothetical protein
MDYPNKCNQSINNINKKLNLFLLILDFGQPIYT